MLLGERAYSDNHMNQGEAEMAGNANGLGSGELRSSKAVKSNGSALKNTLSADKKNSPTKGSSESTSN